MRQIVMVGVLLLLFAGCVPELGVGPASPRPNVMLATDKAPVELVLAAAVRDQYVIPGNASIREVPVTGWRRTLESGFRNAFPKSTRADRAKLELLEAELAFSPAAVSGAGGTVAITANIRIKARLVDASGKELGTLAQTVYAREATTSPSKQGMTSNAALAVEALYELLSKELFSKE